MPELTRDAVLAMKPGRELDALVAEKVLGWSKGYEDDGTPYWATGDTAMSGDWPPSTDVAEAWEVVEDLVSQGFDLDLSSTILSPDFMAVSWGATFSRSITRAKVTGETAPEAICKAALLAVLEGGEAHAG